MPGDVQDLWAVGEPYEQYVGRWSRVVAREFLAWLDMPAGHIWADVGCGTGALTAAIVANAAPQAIVAVDRSAPFLAFARRAIASKAVRFAVGDARALPLASGRCGAAISGLMLNFVPDPAAAVREMARVTQAGSHVALYVWDYRGGMEMMRHFWDAAIEVDPEAAALDESARFALCQPEPLTALFQSAGLRAIAVRAIDIPTTFPDFEAYWAPFLGKQGSAPAYLDSLDAEHRERIRSRLMARLGGAAGGPIVLGARAWAVRGTV
jgi:SAM-dependent methyltransferase